MNTQELSSKLEQSFLLHAKSAATFLKSADSLTIIPGCPPKQLLETYNLRLQNLRRLASSQDNDLQSRNRYHSVAEFVTNLRKEKPLSCTWINATSGGMPEYSIWVDDITGNPLACIHTRPHNKLLSEHDRTRDIPDPRI